MVQNIFYNSKTTKIDSDITNIRVIYGCLEVGETGVPQTLFFLPLEFRHICLTIQFRIASPMIEHSITTI